MKNNVNNAISNFRTKGVTVQEQLNNDQTRYIRKVTKILKFLSKKIKQFWNFQIYKLIYKFNTFLKYKIII